MGTACHIDAIYLKCKIIIFKFSPPPLIFFKVIFVTHTKQHQKMFYDVLFIFAVSLINTLMIPVN